MALLTRTSVAALAVLALCACETDKKAPSPATPPSAPAQKAASAPAAPDAPADKVASAPATPTPDAGNADGAEPPKSLDDDGPEGEDSPQAKNGRVDYTLAEDERFGLVALAVATGLEDRKPTGVADSFGLSSGTLTGWAEVRNKDPETEVTMVWTRDGVEKARTPVKVGTSPGWRTWTRKRLGKRDAGTWQLEVLSPGGDSLGKVSFTVKDDMPADCAAAKGECMEGCEPGWTEYGGKTKKECFDSVCCVKLTVKDEIPANCAAAKGKCMEGCEPGWTEYGGKTKKACFDSVCCVKK